MRRWGRATGLLALVPVLLGSGCGRYVAASKVRHTTATTAEENAVGERVVIPTTAPVATVSAPVATAASAVVHSPTPVHRAANAPRDFCSGPNRRDPVNVEHRDASGLRLTLTVGDKLCFAPNEAASFELDVENISRHIIEYDTSQLSHFVMRPVGRGVIWRDHSCGQFDDAAHSGRPATGPFALEPGERVQFVVDYPGDDDAKARCGGQVGEQDVFGFLFVCPESPDHNDCAVERRQAVYTPGIRIRIGS
jgi:hypothetical protein